MSDLESDVKALLAQIARGGDLSLDEPGQQTLATWAAMTAMVSEYVDRKSVFTSQALRAELYAARRPPHGTTVHAAATAGPPWTHRIIRAGGSFGDGPNSIMMQATTIAFGTAIFHVWVSNLPVQLDFVSSLQGRLLRLWPEPVPSEWSAVERLTTEEVAQVTVSGANFLAHVSGSSGLPRRTVRAVDA